MAKRTTHKKQYCPECLEEGNKVVLGPYQPPDACNYGGRECPECGEFVVEDDGYEYGDGVYEYSDADPGL